MKTIIEIVEGCPSLTKAQQKKLLKSINKYIVLSAMVGFKIACDQINEQVLGVGNKFSTDWAKQEEVKRLYEKFITQKK